MSVKCSLYFTERTFILHYKKKSQLLLFKEVITPNYDHYKQQIDHVRKQVSTPLYELLHVFTSVFQTVKIYYSDIVLRGISKNQILAS